MSSISERELDRLGVRAPVTWFVVPHLAGVAGRLGERLSVYYCIDDYASLPDVEEHRPRLLGSHGGLGQSGPIADV